MERRSAFDAPDPFPADGQGSLVPCALLSFYDEPPEDLVRCVSSLKLLGCESVIAVDGRYAAFTPGAAAASAPEQHLAIVDACAAIGASLTLHVPPVPWVTEAVKRTFMHRLTMRELGWHLVIDADEVIDHVDLEHLDIVLRGPDDVATVFVRERGGPGAARRRMFAGQVFVGPGHCRYTSMTGAVLADTGDPASEVRAWDSGIVMSHGGSRRDDARLGAKDAYYRLRTEDDGKAVCEVPGCGRAASQRVRINWRVEAGSPASDPLDVCQWCAERVREASRLHLLALGLNPDRMTM